MTKKPAFPPPVAPLPPPPGQKAWRAGLSQKHTTSKLPPPQPTTGTCSTNWEPTLHHKLLDIPV
eukprot:1782395-Lingulodinium_polyedra.AAC.1